MLGRESRPFTLPSLSVTITPLPPLPPALRAQSPSLATQVSEVKPLGTEVKLVGQEGRGGEKGQEGGGD